MTHDSLGTVLVAQRRAGIPWKVLQNQYGKSRATLARILEKAQREARNTTSGGHETSLRQNETSAALTARGRSRESDANVAAPALCCTCPAFEPRRGVVVMGLQAGLTGSCRFNPLPIEKEAADWCLHHPALSAVLREMGGNGGQVRHQAENIEQRDPV